MRACLDKHSCMSPFISYSDTEWDLFWWNEMIFMVVELPVNNKLI